MVPGLQAVPQPLAGGWPGEQEEETAVSSGRGASVEGGLPEDREARK